MMIIQAKNIINSTIQYKVYQIAIYVRTMNVQPHKNYICILDNRFCHSPVSLSEERHAEGPDGMTGTIGGSASTRLIYNSCIFSELVGKRNIDNSEIK